MKTAVDWLEDIINQMLENGADLGEDLPALMVHIQQAKEMEKQQIIEARVTAPIIASTNKDDYQTEAEQYYNETYGK